MIYGIGTDIVHVPRIAHALDRFGLAFAQRILGPAEIEEYAGCTRAAPFLAKRFAAKEACAKAMGLGFRDGLALRQITVVHDGKGRPELQFSGYAQCFMEQAGITASHLSLSDETDYAIAFVVLSR